MDEIPGTDEIWKQALSEEYARERALWGKANPVQRAKMMAVEDSRGTGDLFREAMRDVATSASDSGGVARILGGLK